MSKSSYDAQLQQVVINIESHLFQLNYNNFKINNHKLDFFFPQWLGSQRPDCRLNSRFTAVDQNEAQIDQNEDRLFIQPRSYF